VVEEGGETFSAEILGGNMLERRTEAAIKEPSWNIIKDSLL
jgi:hypothetical protein